MRYLRASNVTPSGVFRQRFFGHVQLFGLDSANQRAYNKSAAWQTNHRPRRGVIRGGGDCLDPRLSKVQAWLREKRARNEDWEYKLVRRLPVPIRKIIGDLSNRERVLIGLDIAERVGKK
jgi:hypothetical protein